jgi:hypothetical protein
MGRINLVVENEVLVTLTTSQKMVTTSSPVYRTTGVTINDN